MSQMIMLIVATFHTVYTRIKGLDFQIVWGQVWADVDCNLIATWVAGRGGAEKIYVLGVILKNIFLLKTGNTS